MRSDYDEEASCDRHLESPAISDPEFVAIAVAFWLSAQWGLVIVVVAVVAAIVYCVRTPVHVRRGLLLAFAFFGAVLIVVRCEVPDSEEWAADGTAFTGWMTVVREVDRYPSSERLLVEIHGIRYECWLRRTSLRARSATLVAGDSVMASGVIAPLSDERQARVRWQHVRGELDIEWLGDVVPGSPIHRASNRIRALVTRAGDQMGSRSGALFRGLVIGDDRDQPDDMASAFRRSGLSHLTAVSGQNVALVLAAASPLLNKVRPRRRLALSVALICWFVVLTRAEPSIVRAGVMASLSLGASAFGRRVTPVRALALTSISLLLIDPLLAGSVGFVLSVCATFGVVAIGPAILRAANRDGPAATIVAVTLGAQLGVFLPSVIVFGRSPLVALPANLLAAPVAGLVMLVGLPISMLVALVPVMAMPAVVPVELAVSWIDRVALRMEMIEPVSPLPGVLAHGALGFMVLIALARRRFRLSGAKHEVVYGDLPSHR